MARRMMTFVVSFIVLCVAQSATLQTKAAAAPVDPVALFDQGVEQLGKDPFAAEAKFEAAATEFERDLATPMSQWDRARGWYNVGASRQLAGDVAGAVIALRRAELLAPVTAGLSERLAAARSAARGDLAAPSVLGATTPAKGEVDFDAWMFARDWAFSVPRAWLLWSTIAMWCVLWVAVLGRIVMRWSPLRPGLIVVIVCALGAAAPAGMLVVHELRQRAAELEVVVMSDLAARTEPDDLTGGLAPSGALKAGMELRVVERRVGGNGEEWVRVRPANESTEPAEQEPVPLWVPLARVRPVCE
jgi:hypothetical protein